MKCQCYFLSYVDNILVVCRGIQRNLLIYAFMSKYFFKSLWQRETHVSFFEIIAYEQYKFHEQTSKFLGGLGFNILIQKCFSEEWEQIYQFTLKSKTTEGNLTCHKFSLSVTWINSPVIFFYFFIFLIYETYSHLRGE